MHLNDIKFFILFAILLYSCGSSNNQETNQTLSSNTSQPYENLKLARPEDFQDEIDGKKNRLIYLKK